MENEKLFDLWAKRDPQWEIRYEDSIIKAFCDYGKGNNQLTDARGKILGAGYEIYIYAFFIGLYFDRTRPLNQDQSKVKKFGWAIQNWGSFEARNGRQPYPRLREYMFAALIAKSDIDFIALDKGEIKPRQVVDELIRKMEEYANFGFHYIEDKMIDNPDYYFKETSFLRTFLDFLPKESTAQKVDIEAENDDEPESLD